MAKNWRCIDCGALIWNSFKRCKKCAHIGILNSNYGGGLFGSKNPNWRGGVAKNPYSHKFKTQIRNAVLNKHKVCQMCYSRNDLTVHHINHNRKNDHYSNLIVLCRSCNFKEIWKRDALEMYLGYKCFLRFKREIDNANV